MPPEEEHHLPVPETRPAPESPAMMLQAAIERGIDVEGIRALVEVYERMEAKRAEREYTVALIALQAALPPILKTSRVSFTTKKGGLFDSRFAKLSDMLKILRPLLQEHGFTLTFDQEPRDKKTAAICVLRHKGGHSTKTAFELPTDAAPLISDQHAAASAVSFAQRYALQLALGIVPEEDDDGKAGFAANEKISEAQRHTLEVLLEESKSDSPAFWKYAGVEKGRLAELPARDYARVQQALLQRKAKSQGERP